MIRHGEKPPKVDGKDPDGLSAQGLTRAQGLRQVFGKSSQYNICYILAEHPKSGSSFPRFLFALRRFKTGSPGQLAAIPDIWS